MSKTIAFVCRVIVMLAFLIAIPLIALFGKSLPDALETAWGYLRKPAQESRWPDAEEAPRFNPNAAEFPSELNPSTMTPGRDHSVVAAAHTTDPSRPGTGSSPLSPYTGSNALAQNYPQNGDAATPIATPTPIAVTPFQPYGSQPLVPPQTAAPAIQPIPSQPNSSSFERINRRLQYLGATYYRLELFGSGQPFFRFQCRMAIVGTGGLTRQFEATDQDPTGAMRQVLDKVEAWRQQSQPPQTPSTPPANIFSFPNHVSNVPAPNGSNVPNAFR